MPIFHSQFAETVNPVRSIRPVDIPMLSPIGAIIGNTGAFPWVLDYAKEFSEYLVPMMSYMNAKKGAPGAYGILASRVRVCNGITYYDRAVSCHPKVLAKATKKFADGPAADVLPVGSQRRRGEHHRLRQGGRRGERPLEEGELLQHDLHLEREVQEVPALDAVGPARARRRDAGRHRQRPGHPGQAGLRQDLPQRTDLDEARPSTSSPSTRSSTTRARSTTPTAASTSPAPGPRAP